MLEEGITAAGIKTNQPLLLVKPSHTKWMINVYQQLCSDASLDAILKGFHVSGIMEAVDNAFDIGKISDSQFAWYPVFRIDSYIPFTMYHKIAKVNLFGTIYTHLLSLEYC